MTEVPEHLLQRSKARRAALGLGGDAGDVTAPSAPTTGAEIATTESAAPAAAATPVVEAPPVVEKLPPFVETAIARKKIPFWAASVLAILPVWALVYGLTLDKPTATQAGPLALGSATYASCAGCHGGSGAGGSGPALNGGAVVELFPEIGEHVRWVIEGTSGYQNLGLTTYGATEKPVGGGGVMPGWASLSAEELIGVVRHEREALSGETFDPAQYEEIQTMIDENYPDRSAEFEEAIAGWIDLPTDA